MSQHNRGPWFRGPAGDPYGSVVCNTPVRPENPHEEKDREYYGGYLVAESVVERNRGVIAAAPDLYDACGAALAALEGIALVRDLRIEELSVVKRLRDAIAKADGEEVVAC